MQTEISETDIRPNTMPTRQSGVSKFMMQVYLWMAAGLAVSAASAMAGAYYVLPAGNEAALAFLQTWYGVAAFLGVPIIYTIVLTWLLPTLSKPAAAIWYLGYTAVLGLMLSPIPILYSPTIILQAFAATSAMFCGTAVYGYATKQDLSGWGTLLLMSLLGLIALGVVSWFVPGLNLLYASLGVLLFAAYTAYDAQRMRDKYMKDGDGANLAIYGATSLYLDFANMFTSFLNLLRNGDSK